MRRYGYRPHALIEALHTAQESFGYLDEQALQFASAALHVPLSKVYGVATFYNFFTLKPSGRHTCVVCMGTACYINGAQPLLEAIGKVTGIKPGETTSDGSVSVLTARCFGSCGLAPAVVFDGVVSGRVQPGEAVDKIRGWMQG